MKRLDYISWDEYFISGRAAMALDPTGSAVRIYRSTMDRRTFFFRSLRAICVPPIISTQCPRVLSTLYQRVLKKSMEGF